MALIARNWSVAAIFVAAGSTYLMTLCPSVYVEGSGELIGATYMLGTPHPTGYPLYVLLGRLIAGPLSWWQLSPAFAVNVASALMSALAAAAVAALLRSRRYDNWICFSAALTFACSATFWSQSVIAEVYGLSMFAVALATAATLGACDRKDARLLLLAGFLSGLGITAHLNQILVLPGFALLIVWSWLLRRTRWSASTLIAAGLFGLFGYSIVLYLPLRNGLGNAFHWGPLDTPRLLVDHLTAATYRSSFSLPPGDVALANLERWLGQMTGEFHLLLVPLVIWGLVVVWCRDRSAAILATSAIATNLGAIMTYHRDPNGLDVFSLVSILFAAILLASGLENVCAFCRRALGGGTGVLRLMGLLVPFLVLNANRDEADRSENWIPHRYGTQILRQLPEEAILITEGDDASFIVDYLQRVEGMRPEVSIYNRLGRGSDLLADNEQHLDPALRASRRHEREAVLLTRAVKDESGGRPGRPVFYLAPRRMPGTGMKFVPMGLVYGVAAVSDSSIGADLPKLDMSNADDTTVYRDPWVLKLQSNYWFMRAQRLAYNGRQDLALKAYKRAAATAPESRTVHYNTAVIMFKKNRLEDAMEHIEVSLDLDPLQPEAYRLSARILRRQGRHRKAESMLQKASELARIP